MKRKKRFQRKYRDESYKDITDNKLGIKFNIHKLMKKIKIYQQAL